MNGKIPLFWLHKSFKPKKSSYTNHPQMLLKDANLDSFNLSTINHFI